jgi:hypothetical protein
MILFEPPRPEPPLGGPSPRVLASSGRRSYRRPMRKSDLQVLHEILETHGAFGHREHLALAWNYLLRYPIDEAGEVMVAAIRHVARLHGPKTNITRR